MHAQPVLEKCGLCLQVQIPVANVVRQVMVEQSVCDLVVVP